MSGYLNDCEACTRCDACQRPWCREQQPSPGEADGICRDCFETEPEETP